MLSPHRNFRLITLSLTLLIYSNLATAADKGWIEVGSLHFRVLSDGGDKDARRLAREFEQIRAVFSMTYPGLRFDSGAPLLVLAPRDEGSMKALLPWMWKLKGAKPAGVFFHGWEKQFAVVRLDEVSPEAYQVVYHEYAHTLLHLNSRWLPVWLDEGLAEVYAGTRFEPNKVYIGVPLRGRVTVLQSRPLIPLDTLLAVTQASPYYHDEDKIHMFYAESWALTHFLMFSPEMERGKRFRQFLSLLENGVEQKKAFRDAIGESKLVEKVLDQYIHRFTIQEAVLNNPPHLSEGEFASRRLTWAETQTELGGFHLWRHDREAARSAITEALNADPKLALAHENMGFLNFDEGKDQEAALEFDQARRLDGKLYLSAFYRAMLSPAARLEATADEESFRYAIMNVLELNPQFAPAYIQLVRVALRQGNLEHALGFSRKAEQLEPHRAGYHTLSGNILLRLGRNAEAAAFAKYVADRWSPPDHDEAMELWNKIPVGDRTAGNPPSETTSSIKDTQLISGTLKSATCGDKASGLAVVIDHDGQPLIFQSKGPLRGGFSDTIWYGEDHFSFCKHVEGLRTVIHYKPATDKSYAGDLMELDFREDFPMPTPAPKTQQTSAEKKPQ